MNWDVVIFIIVVFAILGIAILALFIYGQNKDQKYDEILIDGNRYYYLSFFHNEEMNCYYYTEFYTKLPKLIETNYILFKTYKWRVSGLAFTVYRDIQNNQFTNEQLRDMIKPAEQAYLDSLVKIREI